MLCGRRIWVQVPKQHYLSQEKVCSLYSKEHKVAAGWFRHCPFILVSWSLPSGSASWQTKNWDIDVFMKKTSRHYWLPEIRTHLMPEVRVLPYNHISRTQPVPSGWPWAVPTLLGVHLVSGESLLTAPHAFQDISSYWSIWICIGTILFEQFLMCK